MDKEQLEEMLERHEERDLQSTCNKLATDCISRQEAIECLNGEMKLSSFENAQIVQDYLVRVVEKLYDLPSAQPEILACGEGELVIPKQQWVPVSEGLPGYGEDVLVSVSGYCNVGHIVPTNDEKQYNWYYSGWYHDPYDVDAWMPLPEPYREESRR